MMFDDILHKVGKFGLYQKRLLLLICITGGCVIIQNLSPVFTMAIPEHRCKIPGYANDTYNIQSLHHALLINQSIPRTEEGDYEQCTVYHVSPLNDGYSAGNRTLRNCEEWVYDKSVFTETLSSKLNIVCDKKIYRSHTSMMIFAGKFVGAFLSSICGDHFGRRRVYMVMMLAMLGSVVGLAFVTSLPALMALRFVVGGTTTGCYLCTYIIGMELMGKSQRWFTTLAFKSCEILMTLMATLSAYLFRDWSHFQASLAAPCLLVLTGYFFIPESPRWLMSKGMTDSVKEIMCTVARVNGVQPPETFGDFQHLSLESSSVSPFRLFRVPRLLLRYTLLYFCWILTTMNQYGLMLNVSNMSGNIFLNFALMAGVDLLSLTIYMLFIERVGRRPLLMSVTGFGGMACVATVLPIVLGGNSWISRGLSIAGRMCTATAFMSIYVMSPELFPTVLRSFGLGSCSMLARIGGLASPYVADLSTFVSGVWGTALPQLVFGVAGIVTASLVLVLPETKGQRLPETVKDLLIFDGKVSDPPERMLTDTTQADEKECHTTI